MNFGDSVGGAVAEERSEGKGHRDEPKVTQARSCRGHGFRRHECEWPGNGSNGGLPGAKDGAVAAPGNLDEQRIGLAFAGVILQEPRAEPAGFDPHGGVDGGVVGVVTIEDIEGEAVLLEWLAGVVEGVVDNVAKEELAAVCSGKKVGVQDALELRVGGVAHKRLVERNVTVVCR